MWKLKKKNKKKDGKKIKPDNLYDELKLEVLKIAYDKYDLDELKQRLN